MNSCTGRTHDAVAIENEIVFARQKNLGNMPKFAEPFHCSLLFYEQ